MAAKVESKVTIRRLLHATFWLCASFALAGRMLPNPFTEDLPPPFLGGQVKMYYLMVMPVIATPFGAGVGALVGRTGTGALTGFVSAVVAVLWLVPAKNP